MSTQLNNSTELELLSVEIEPGIRYVFDDSYVVDPGLIESNPFVVARLPRPIFVTKMSKHIVDYNKMVLPSSIIKQKTEFDESVIESDTWNIPDNYKNLTLTEMFSMLLDRQKALGFEEIGLGPRSTRIVQELKAYKQINKFDMLRLMFYIVDVMTERSQVWGVGRGSSVSSYVLFLIGVHDVDSFEFDLDFADFVKDQ